MKVAKPKPKTPEANCKCKQCGKEFHSTQSRIKSGRGLYCSRECLVANKWQNVIHICQNPLCKNSFEVLQSVDKKGSGKYCSITCKAIVATGTKKPRNVDNCICQNPLCGKVFSMMPSKIKEGKGKYCSRKCASDSRKGENHHNWKNGKYAEANGLRNTIRYAEWRKEVYERDQYTCKHCGETGRTAYLQAHHVIPFSVDETLRFELSNAITLCTNCHKKEHKRLRTLLKDKQMDFFVV